MFRLKRCPIAMTNVNFYMFEILTTVYEKIQKNAFIIEFNIVMSYDVIASKSDFLNLSEIILFFPKNYK